MEVQVVTNVCPKIQVDWWQPTTCNLNKSVSAGVALPVKPSWRLPYHEGHYKLPLDDQCLTLLLVCNKRFLLTYHIQFFADFRTTRIHTRVFFSLLFSFQSTLFLMHFTFHPTRSGTSTGWSQKLHFYRVDICLSFSFAAYASLPYNNTATVIVLLNFCCVSFLVLPFKFFLLFSIVKTTYSFLWM